MRLGQIHSSINAGIRRRCVIIPEHWLTVAAFDREIDFGDRIE
jgi:hypothetical protein